MNVFVNTFLQIYTSIILCYYIDNEMYTGNQRYTEQFLQDYMDDIYDLTGRIETDQTYFGIVCNKGNLFLI